MKKVLKRITSIVCMMALLAGCSLTYLGTVVAAEETTDYEAENAVYTPQGVPALKYELYEPDEEKDEEYALCRTGKYLSWNFNTELDIAKSTAKEITWLMIDADVTDENAGTALKNAVFHLSNQTIDQTYIDETNTEEIEKIFETNTIKWGISVEDDGTETVVGLSEMSGAYAVQDGAIVSDWTSGRVQLWIPFTSGTSVYGTKGDETTNYDLSAKNNSYMITSNGKDELTTDGDIKLYEVAIYTETAAEFEETNVIGPGGVDMQDPYLKLNYPLEVMPYMMQALVNVEAESFLSAAEIVENEGYATELYTVGDEGDDIVPAGTVVARAAEAVADGESWHIASKSFLAKNFSVNDKEDIRFAFSIYNGTGKVIDNVKVELTSAGVATASTQAMLRTFNLETGWNHFQGDKAMTLAEFLAPTGYESGTNAMELSKVDYFRIWNLNDYNVGEILISNIELIMPDYADIELVNMHEIYNDNYSVATGKTTALSNPHAMMDVADASAGTQQIGTTTESYNFVAQTIQGGQTQRTLVQKGITWNEALDISDYELSELSVEFWYMPYNTGQTREMSQTGNSYLYLASNYNENGETVSERYFQTGQKMKLDITAYINKVGISNLPQNYTWYKLSVPLSEFTLNSGTTKEQILRFFQQEFNMIFMYHAHDGVSGSYTVGASDIRLVANDTDAGDVYEEKLGRSILHCDSTDEVITPYWPSSVDGLTYDNGDPVDSSLANQMITEETVVINDTTDATDPDPAQAEGTGAYIIDLRDTTENQDLILAHQRGKGQLWELTFARNLNLANYKDGDIQFKLYINDLQYWNGDLGFSLSSAGNWDVDSVYWTVPKSELQNGWNLISVNLDNDYSGVWDSKGTNKEFTIDWEAINYFRVIQTGGAAATGLITMLDDVRVVENNPMIFSNCNATNEDYYGFCVTESGYPALIWNDMKYTLVDPDYKDIRGKGWVTLHTVRSISDGTVRFSIDGVERGYAYFAVTKTTLDAPQVSHCIGADANGGQIFDGRIARVDVWKQAEGATEDSETSGVLLDGWYLASYTEEDDGDYKADDGNEAGSLHNLQIDVESMTDSDNQAGWRGVTVWGTDSDDTQWDGLYPGFRYTTGCFNDISKYRNTDENAYYKGSMSDEIPVPEKADYMFAGWFKDSDCMEPIDDDQLSGEGWAKWVRADMLTVKAQTYTDYVIHPTTGEKVRYLKTDYALDENGQRTGTMRFVTSIDSDRYHKVGFKVELYSSKAELEAGTPSQTLTGEDKTVHERLYVLGSDGSYETTKPTEVFTTIAEYFKTYILRGFNEDNAATYIKATPYYITLDGTRVYGDSTVKRMQDWFDANSSVVHWEEPSFE